LKLFNKNRLNNFWSFSQTGNIWRFIFGGEKYIIGETRDTINKNLFLFTIDYTTGKTYIKNFPFENDNFWVSIEGATSEIFFLGRFEKPELPYQKKIIALDIKTGRKLWENEKYCFLFNTEEAIYGINRKFQENEIAEIDLKTGEVLITIPENEHLKINELRNKNEDFIFENSNYPKIFSKSENEENISDIFNKLCYKDKEIGSIEYIQKASLLIFNYYIKFGIDENSTDKINYENRFVIYDMKKSEILCEDTINKITNYCVPDCFFIKNNFLFYLKEKNELNCIKLI
jgi:hypothetical protein